MSITTNATITVYNGVALSASATETVQPPAGFGTGGRGRLVHPSSYPSGYDYPYTPDETVNVEVVAAPPPSWAITQTLGGASEALWTGYTRGMRVIERWVAGDTGGLLTHLGALWTMFADPPDPDAAEYVTWSPNYSLSASYNVAIVAVRAGGEPGYKLLRRLAGLGYAPQPVELELAIIGLAD